MTQFASVDDLATLTTLAPEEEAAADMLLTAASAAIIRATGQQFELVTNDDAVLRGTWDRTLVLPQRPVVAVSAVSINGLAVPTGTWLLAGYTLYRGHLPIFNGPDDWGGDIYLTSWGGPMSAVQVTYTHGFAQIPADVAMVCMQAALRALRNPEGDTGETIGQYSHQTAPDHAAGIVLTDAEQAALSAYDPAI